METLVQNIKNYPFDNTPNNEVRLVRKYKRLAAKADFTNNWLRRIADADESKTLYQNGITTGNRIDGKCVTFKTVAKYCGEYVAEQFRNALESGTNYESCRFDFCGYDGTLWVNDLGNGEKSAGFSKEYRNCGNGYYYMMINKDTFIGYDID